MLSQCQERTSFRLGMFAPALVAPLLCALLALAVLGVGSPTTPAMSAKASVAQAAYPVTLVASVGDIRPAGYCAFGHNPDGSCRGHRASAAAKRCAKAAPNGYRNGASIGSKVGAGYGGAVGAIGTRSAAGTYLGATRGAAINSQIGGAYGAALYCGLYASGD